MTSLISPDQTWILWSILLVAAALGFWSQRTSVGARLSAAVVTMLIAAVLSNTGVIPAQAPVYSYIREYFLPFAIPLLLFQGNIVRILRESAATLVAFAIGIIGILVGVVVVFFLVPLGEADWQVASVFSSLYIGDSANYHDVAKSVGLSSDKLISGGIIANNLMLVMYLLILFVLPSLYRVRRYFPETPDPDRFGKTEHILKRETLFGSRLNLPVLTTAFTLSAILCAVSFELESLFGLKGMAILIISAISVSVAAVVPARMIKLESANELGMMIMQIFFATLGASAHIGAMLNTTPLLFVYAGIILLIHLIFVLLGGKLLKLSLPQILIASNASVGNPITTTAMAASRHWNNLILPGVICASLGYGIANFIAKNVGDFFH